jgi:hypothetical protein
MSPHMSQPAISSTLRIDDHGSSATLVRRPREQSSPPGEGTRRPTPETPSVTADEIAGSLLTAT